MKILPSEPTREMLNAGWLEADRRIEDGKDAGMIAIYRAMASAYVFDEAAAVARVAEQIASADRNDFKRLPRVDQEQYRVRARAAFRALMEGE